MNFEFFAGKGIRIPKGWPEEIGKAQSESMIRIAGEVWNSWPYGSKSANGFSASRTCHDLRSLKLLEVQSVVEVQCKT